MSDLSVFYGTDAAENLDVVSGNPPAQTVCVVGLGYIGLPTASVLADRGYQVHGVDIRQNVVDTINRGEIHIHEPGLGALVAKVVSEGKLQASTEPAKADIFFICVPTPLLPDRSPDLSYVTEAARSIRPHVRAGNIIILESTSPPKTTEELVVREALPPHLTPGKNVTVAYCPERVLPGKILTEVIENDRVVGGVTPKCAERVKQFYETFVSGEVITTTAASAEMVKLVENAYRDVNIAFANELSMLADHFAVDPFEVIALANRHPRVNILSPGPGVGGHCISVDPWFLVDSAPKHTDLIQTAREVNDRKADWIVEKIRNVASDNEHATIGCLGLTYKANVDDLRESPSLKICRAVATLFPGRVIACDPFIQLPSIDGVPIVPIQDAIQNCEILVILTDHDQFLAVLESIRPDATIIDTRGISIPKSNQASAPSSRLSRRSDQHLSRAA